MMHRPARLVWCGPRKPASRCYGPLTQRSRHLRSQNIGKAIAVRSQVGTRLGGIGLCFYRAGLIVGRPVPNFAKAFVRASAYGG
jgi:hypothetical protein